jgi:hypothetical protein
VPILLWHAQLTVDHAHRIAEGPSTVGILPTSGFAEEGMGGAPIASPSRTALMEASRNWDRQRTGDTPVRFFCRV